MSKQQESRSIIKGTASIPRTREISLGDAPSFPAQGFTKADAALLVSHLAERGVKINGPYSYRSRGSTGGWAYRFWFKEGWIAELAFAHALNTPRDRGLFIQRLDRLLSQRDAVETAYRLQGFGAVLAMLGEKHLGEAP